MPSSATATRRLEWLQHQREATFGELTEMCERAASEDRDLSDSEQSAVDSRREAIGRFDAELATEAELARAQGSYQDLMADIGPFTGSAPAGGSGATSSGQPAGAPGHHPEIYRSAGEYLVDYLLRGEDPARAARFDSYFRANMTTADTPGILPTPIVGPVWTTINSRRPAIEAATVRPLPGGGKTFQRPYVTQHTLVGTQAAEKTALPSQALKIDPKTITKMTKGGWVNLSFQDRDWTDPAVLDILISDLAAVYAQETDHQFCLDLVAAVGQDEVVPSNDAQGWLTAIYNAAAQVAAVDNRLPNTFWVSIDVWAQLGALVDGAGRPLFPTAAPANSMGDVTPGQFAGSIAGMRLAVDSHFPPRTGIIGDNLATEFYETVGGQVQATEPSLLGTQIAFYGYMADCVVEPNALVKLIAPALPLSAGRSGGRTGGRSGPAEDDEPSPEPEPKPKAPNGKS
jgi:HK97 family phage major capsid protein